VLERILLSRSLGGTDVHRFLDPCLSELQDPMLLQDMAQAATRLARAIQDRESIVIFGDYDADGATATALLVRVIRHLGGCVDYYIPHRIEEGYGLSVVALESLAAKGARLVVTVDTGISGREAARAARRLGLDLIITDHHQPGPELPEALAVVNPNRRDCNSPTPGLAGVGVAFKLAHAVLRTLGRDPAESRALLGSLLEFVAIGSVADFAPLVGENRVLVRHGLQRLARTQSVGLRALMKVARIQPRNGAISASEIGFQIGPRINAAGRTSDARICVELLTTNDESRAEEIALELESFNRERRRIENAIVQECLDLIELRPELGESRVVVLSGPSWHPGVIGIVAARILQKLWRPTIILSEEAGLAKGSARSIPGYDIFRALTACGDLIDRFGGHSAAAGMTLAVDRIPALRTALNRHAEEVLAPEDLIPLVEIDALVELEELNEKLVADISRMEPFGQQNPEPVLAVQGAQLTEPPRTVRDKHLRLRLKNPSGDTLVAMGWNMTASDWGLDPDCRQVDLAFQPTMSEFNGHRTLELRIKAVRPSNGGAV
jgi:single-stranded-DNA-specific exonuclease